MLDENHFIEDLSAIVLWQSHLNYSRLLTLSWFGLHLFCGGFLLLIGSGYEWIDYCGIALLGIIIFKSKGYKKSQIQGSLIWYKDAKGNYYIFYRQQHYRLKGYPQRFYHLVLFETQSVPNLFIVAQDSVPYPKWRSLLSTLAYYSPRFK